MNPSLAHYQLLRRLRQQVRHHSGGASVIYLFSDYALANQWLTKELDAHLLARTMRLHILTPASAEQPPAALLQPILSSGSDSAGMHYWLALGEPALEWDAYRDRILARLNESRSVLVKNRAFIFLLLPAHFEGRAAAVAPDLWSVRGASHVVPPWLANEEHRSTSAGISHEPVRAQEDKQQAPAENLVLRRWQEQWNAWDRNRSQRLSPNLAWQLVDQLLEQQQLHQARAVAAQALEVSRQLKSLTDDAPQSLRDLSVSLNCVGDVARDLGQLEEARSAYQEALGLVQRLLKVLSSDRELAPFEESLRASLRQIDPSPGG